MNVNKVIIKAKKMAEEKGYELINIDAKVLMIYVLKISYAEFVISRRELNVTKKQQEEYYKYVNELIDGKPLQYITNERRFMSHKFYVDENVLIPQMDTEVLVQEAADIINDIAFNDKIKVLDLCTGSGAIAISLKSLLKNKIEITATDISEKALNVAKKNAESILQDNNCIEFIQSDMFKNIKGKFDMIVSNPPYIETETIKTLPKDVQNEPHIALDGGEDGLDFYRIIKANYEKYLNKDGYLLMEIGYNQKKPLMEMFPGAKCIKDFADNDRVIIWRNKR